MPCTAPGSSTADNSPPRGTVPRVLHSCVVDVQWESQSDLAAFGGLGGRARSVTTDAQHSGQNQKFSQLRTIRKVMIGSHVIMSDVARIKTERNTRSTWGILGTLVRRPCVTKRATLFDRSERHKRSRACTHFSAAPAKSDCSYWQYASSDSTARLCNSAMQRTTNACLCEVASTSEVMAAARGQMVCGAAVQSLRVCVRWQRVARQTMELRRCEGQLRWRNQR
jgi:hypothetical protein